MASFGEVHQALLDAISSLAADIKEGSGYASKSAAVLRLAEAYAWLANPAQSHGGSSEVSVGK